MPNNDLKQSSRNSKEILLATKGLIKSFTHEFTLGPIDITMDKGDQIAIVGANGAGKSTFFGLISGHIDSTDGDVEFQGQLLNPDAFSLKRHIGYLPQDAQLPSWVSALELLHYACGLYEISDASRRVAAQLSFWDCESFSDRALNSCSYGMAKRVGLALASLHQPSLLILDEPFSGLDVAHIKSLEALLARRRDLKKTTILSTHVASYAAKYCDRVLLLEKGKMNEINDWRGKDSHQREGMFENFFQNISSNQSNLLDIIA